MRKSKYKTRKENFTIYKNKQHTFDKCYRFYECQYKQKLGDNIEALNKSDPTILEGNS